MSTKAHKARASKHVNIALLTVSTSRGIAEDKSGQWMNKKAKKKGHTVVFHEVVPDDEQQIRDALLTLMQVQAPDVILISGGTGIARADVTIEAVRPLFAKELNAFGGLFAALSYEEIDAAALLSRATAGIIGQALVFCMPGSLKACKLACEELIFPELGHLVHHLKE